MTRPSWLRALIVLLLLLVSGCSLLPGGGTPTPPAWYAQPAAEPAGVWWGYGTGQTKQQATQKGLVDIAARIKTTVSEELRVQTGRYDDRTRRTMNQLTRQTIDDTQFIGYQVAQHEQRGGNHFVKVAVDRSQFLARQRAELEQIADQLDTLMTSFRQGSAAAKLKKMPQIRELVERGQGLAELLNAFGQQASTRTATQRFNDYRTSMTRARERIQFHVSHDPASRYIARHLTALLNAEQLPVTTRSDPGGHTIHIDIDTQVKHYSRGSEVRATLTSRFTAAGDADEQISSRQATVSAASLQGREKALENASELLRRQIAERGVLDFLGL